jgi:hypothetical protein
MQEFILCMAAQYLYNERTQSQRPQNLSLRGPCFSMAYRVGKTGSQDDPFTIRNPFSIDQDTTRLLNGSELQIRHDP